MPAEIMAPLLKRTALSSLVEPLTQTLGKPDANIDVKSRSHEAYYERL